MNIVYFDNSATTKPHKEVIDEVQECMEFYYANPSSSHRLGIEAERKIKLAREKVSRLIGSLPKEIIFTSGGSESNNTALRGVLLPGDHVISSKIEHPSVIKALRSLEDIGFDVTYLDVDKNGIINLDELRSSLKANTKLVTIMHANNEIGSIQPIDEIVKMVKQYNKRIKIHIDAVQSAGKISIDVRKTDIDMISLSAHKIHGPKGVGALYIKNGLNIKPLIIGGGQEMDLRSGTENVPGISGFGVASEIMSSDMEHKTELVDNIKRHFIRRLSEIDEILINSPCDNQHIGNILSVSFIGVRGEVLLHYLEDYNIFVSTGSACSAKKSSSKNYVLPSIGLKECNVEGTIRFSFSCLNTVDEVDYTIEILKKALTFLRRIKK